MKLLVLLIVVTFLAGGCDTALSDSASPQPAEAPRSAGGTTDAAFDWENPHPAPGNRNWADSLTFRSTKTLDQTTAWLQWAIERYGHVDEPAWKTDVSDVRFRGCSMEWVTRQVSAGVTTESRYSVPLRDVDLRLKTINGSSRSVSFGLTSDTEVVKRYVEDGREKGTGHDEVSSVVLSVRNEDQIGERIAWALIHASRLCGAPIRTEY